MRDIPGRQHSARCWKYRWRSCRRCCSSIHTFTITRVLFFVVYFAILVLFMTIYGSFSVRKYRTRELVFAFGLSSFFTDTIAYFLMCMIAKMLLPPKYVILTLLLQCLVETGIFILARILADRLEPPALALLIVPEKDAEENSCAMRQAAGAAED